MRFLKADKLFNGKEFLKDGSVLVLNSSSELLDIATEESLDPAKIESFEGFITPGFVNAHCHTELSHLKSKISQKTGLPGFGKEIIFKRNAFSKEEIKEKITSADKEMFENGIVAVGDICNTADSIETKTSGKIHYHSFIELLGFHPNRANDSFKSGLEIFNQFKNSGLATSLAPHAPYSTSNNLISLISNFNSEHQFPSSIHNEESEEEEKFFKGIKSGFEDLYNFLQMDISWFKAPLMSSLKYYSSSLQNQKTILVHNTFSSKDDVNEMKDKNIAWCFCPNANLYIEDKLPDLKLFSDQMHKVCIGTDSLASNLQLDLISELNVLLTNFSHLTITDLLPAITFNSAKALNIDDRFGSFIIGKNCGLNLIKENNRQIKLVKKVV